MFIKLLVDWFDSSDTNLGSMIFQIEENKYAYL